MRLVISFYLKKKIKKNATLLNICVLFTSFYCFLCYQYTFKYIHTYIPISIYVSMYIYTCLWSSFRLSFKSRCVDGLYLQHFPPFVFIHPSIHPFIHSFIFPSSLPSFHSFIHVRIHCLQLLDEMFSFRAMTLALIVNWFIGDIVLSD